MYAYASRVALGFRPPVSCRVPPALWELVQACWQQDPALRPSMFEVMEALHAMVPQAQEHMRQPTAPMPIAAGRKAAAAAPIVSPSRGGKRRGPAAGKKEGGDKCRMM